jgi:signal peptidase I
MLKKDDMRGLEPCYEPAGSLGKTDHVLLSALVMENAEGPEGGSPETQEEPEKQEDEIISSRMATKKKQRKKEIISWIISLSAAVVFALFLRFFVFEFVRVDGSSMENTLWHNEIVLVEKVSYRFSQPHRFDIVFFNSASEGTLVKRVIGLPGDTVEVRDSKLLLNGNAVEEEYIKEPMVAENNFGPYTVKENEVFCMGDNRNISIDSRDPAVGPVPFNTILGRGVFVIYPFNKISALPQVTEKP